MSEQDPQLVQNLTPLGAELSRSEGILPLARGGTGGYSDYLARMNLGLVCEEHVNSLTQAVRFITSVQGTGTVAFDDYGFRPKTGTTTGSTAKGTYDTAANSAKGYLFSGQSLFFASFAVSTFPVTCEGFIGMGVSAMTTGHVFGGNNIGFLLNAGDLILVRVNGGTKTSTTLVTLAEGDFVRAYIYYNGGGDALVGYSINGAAWSIPKQVSGGYPATTSAESLLQFSLANVASTDDAAFKLGTFTFRRYGNI